MVYVNSDMKDPVQLLGLQDLACSQGGQGTFTGWQERFLPTLRELLPEPGEVVSDEVHVVTPLGKILHFVGTDIRARLQAAWEDPRDCLGVLITPDEARVLSLLMEAAQGQAYAKQELDRLRMHAV